MQPSNPFRTACIKVYGVSLPWKKMQSKLKYVAWCEESDGVVGFANLSVCPEKTYFRVYAYTVVPMRMPGWQKMFKNMSVSVRKIKHRIDKDKGYKARLTKGQLSEWGGRPYPAGIDMAAAGDSDDSGFISESEVKLMPILDESYKMKISFICSDLESKE
jgi:hypothetical protein